MLKDEDRIFKNLYNDLGWEIDPAINREDWSSTKNIINKGKEEIIVKVLKVDDRGKISLTMKDVTDEEKASVA